MKKFKTSAIILAGGAGSRMQSEKTKQFIKICGKTVIERAISAFDKSSLTDEIIVVVRADEAETLSSLIQSLSCTKSLKLVAGGACRAESAKNGFLAVCDDAEFVAVHDAARCLITPAMIDKVIEKAYTTDAASAVCGVSDTVKMVDESGVIAATLPRDRIYRAQTPQVFKKTLYQRALDSCEDLASITDDNMLLEAIGVNVHAVNVGACNIKITTQDDLTLARNILIERGEAAMSGFRIGHGYDVHKLTENRKLIIGGVDIPYEKGLLGHSDADVLVHAIMDALLGAAGLGDIGRHFPDTSDEYKGISSIHLLTKVMSLLKSSGFKVVNVDATLVMQKPKVAAFVPKMVSNIAFALGIAESCINVKATTEEHLGFTGREEGAAAHAVAMIVSE